MPSIDQILEQEFAILFRDIQDRYNKSGVRASGKTLNSLSARITSTGGQVLGPEYIGVIEGGRKPGGIPKDFDQILRKWISAKGLSFGSESEVKQFIWFVSNKIRKEGTALFRSGRKNDIYTTPIKDFEKRLATQTSKFYTTEIINQVLKFDKEK